MKATHMSEEKIRKFQQAFDAVHMRYGLSETTKVKNLNLITKKKKKKRGGGYW